MVRPVAVIDVGTNSIRMAVAQIDAAGGVQRLETLSKAVNLGKDTFTRGSIRKATIEECVRVLADYCRVLREYRIEGPDDIRVVATSAVREASNRQAFIDRVLIATGLRVEAIDDAEVNRLTYLGIRPVLDADESLRTENTLVIEIGGGSTEVLVLHEGDVISSQTYRLGALRLHRMLESHQPGSSRLRNVMGSHIRRTIDAIRRDLPDDREIRLVALGSDVRFAVAQLQPEWSSDRVARIPTDQLEPFVEDLVAMSTDEIVHRHKLTFLEAETVGPTLLAYLLLARAFDRPNLVVAGTTLRDGLLMEMAVGGAWTEAFSNQIIRSAVGLGRRFGFAEPHAMHVAQLSRVLFHALQDEHQLEPRYELLLYIAALLHDIGNVISNRAHHKHSMYLILNAELFGLGRKDLLLVALVARYHRRAEPRPMHEGYAELDSDSRIVVAKLAAILRIADALDRSDSQRVADIRCGREKGRFVITVPAVDDLSLEQLAIKQKGAFFEDVFGMKVLLRARSDSERG
jgi:exopolyphosphatase/guanosine-5'-triphosphate,3'-diphosphate pyrophosphatase